ncbi:MAG TPA: TfoX/Sxy family protein [Blastocatellia bacterium]|jgi:DNA transformation protein|nr:TfoX/Sxy family protein [Blastocatellia bacterium]
MPVSKGYLDYVLDQLSCLGTIAHKRMFGGVGLYSDGLFFALIDDDIVYFKVDDNTRRRYEAARTRPFQPGGEGPSQSGYYSLPINVLEDLDQLKAWATEAVEVARRKASGKKPRTRPRK